jgi:hypothetical protein
VGLFTFLPNPAWLKSPIHTPTLISPLSSPSLLFGIFLNSLHIHRESDWMIMGQYRSVASWERQEQRLIAKFGDKAKYNIRTGIEAATGANVVPLGQRAARPSCSDNSQIYNISAAGDNSYASKPISSSDRVRNKLEGGKVDDRQVRLRS